MGVNSGPVICCTTAAITHSQRMNSDDDEKDYVHNLDLTNRENKERVDLLPESSSKKILKELKSVVEQEKCKDENGVSIYDLLKLLREKQRKIKALDDQLLQTIKTRLKIDVFCSSILFDQKDMELNIIYNGKTNYFTKRDGKLVIAKNNCWDTKDLLVKCGKEISERYDKFVEDIGFYREGMDSVKTINSNFVITCGEYNLSISEQDIWSSSFILSAKIGKDQYDYQCNSNKVLIACRNNEDEIFKRIFVKIADCPKWTQQTLYQIRQEQLGKKERVGVESFQEHEEIRNKDVKKQKRLELVRKISLFRKK